MSENYAAAVVVLPGLCNPACSDGAGGVGDEQRAQRKSQSIRGALSASKEKRKLQNQRRLTAELTTLVIFFVVLFPGTRL